MKTRQHGSQTYVLARSELIRRVMHEARKQLRLDAKTKDRANL